MSAKSSRDTAGRQDMGLRSLHTPRAAALAGVFFALLFSASLLLLQSAVPTDVSAETIWVEDGADDASEELPSADAIANDAELRSELVRRQQRAEVATEAQPAGRQPVDGHGGRFVHGAGEPQQPVPQLAFDGRLRVFAVPLAIPPGVLATRRISAE